MGVGTFFGNTKLGKSIVKSLSGNTSTSNLSSGITSMPPSTFISNVQPVWKNFSELIFLLDCYYSNPVVQAIINIKAEAFANMKFKVKDLKTGEIVKLSEYEKDNGKLFELISQPNPLQSTKEWLRQFKVNYEVFGDGFMYGFVPVGWEDKFNYTDVLTINNLPSYNMATSITGNWLSATTKEEIISHYTLIDFNNKKRRLHTNSVMHLNNTNIKFDKNFTGGKSDLLALKMPITNIEKAFESRNVIIRKRGALGILTSEKKDDVMGSLPLNKTEMASVQEAFKDYGLMDDQYSHIISPVPLKYQKTAMSVKELMLFEEIESSAIAIANSKGVPELLAKYYLKGGTFNNLDASEKRLYDSTIIPETEDFITGFNRFLKIKDLGIELLGTYDHLHILQINKKEEAETNSKKEQTALSAFKIGAITYNVYLIAIGMPLDDTIGDLRIWDLSLEQRNALGLTSNNTQQNGTSNGQ